MSIVIEVGFELLFSLGAESGWRAAAKALRARKGVHRLLWAVALAITGAILGALSGVFFPNRIFGFRGLRGSTMIVSPFVTGALMEAYGRWCDRRGRERTYFATFWGGGIFAFAMAAVRFYFVGTGR